MRRRLILLPGLHGTADLFGQFIDHTPDGWDVVPIGFPDEPLGYAELESLFVDQLAGEDCLLLGESFSGPLSLRLARRLPNVRGVVLCATFLRRPIHPLKRFVPWSVAARIPPPLFLRRWVLTGGDVEVARELQTVVRSVRPDALAHRIRETLRVDAREDLAALTIPILAIRASRDRLIGPHSVADMRAGGSHVRVVEIEGPHLVLQTKAAAVWAAIESFVDGMA